jgi:nucleoside 2-deoxyribosyltransferase
MAKSSWDQIVLQRLQKKLKDSDVFLALLTEQYKTDPTCLVQLGYAIMMEKPLVFMAPEGTKIPRALQRLADHIVFYKTAEDLELAVEDVRAWLLKKKFHVEK